MSTFNKSLLAVAIMAGGISAANASMLTFDDTSLGGDNIFDFDELSITDIEGTSVITQFDTNGDGTLIGDTFAELGLTGAIRFNLSGAPLSDATTGLTTEYDLIFKVDFSGAATAIPLDLGGTPDPEIIFLTALFSPASSAELFYDTGFDWGTGTFSGGETKVGELTGGNGSCSVTVTIATGTETGGCDINFDYLQLTSGLMSYKGTSLDLLDPSIPVHANLDINVDEFDPGLSFFYPGGPGTSQSTGVSHDGTIRIDVPEPSSVALLGLGLLGLGATARRRKA